MDVRRLVVAALAGLLAVVSGSTPDRTATPAGAAKTRPVRQQARQLVTPP